MKIQKTEQYKHQKLQTVYQNKLKEVENRHKKELKEVENRHKKELKEAENRHEKELEELRTIYQNNLDKAETMHKVELEEVKGQLSNTLLSIDDLNNKLKIQQQIYTKGLKDLQDTTRRMTKHIKHQHNTSEALLEQKNKLLESEVSKQKELNKRLNALNQYLQHEIERLQKLLK